MFTYRIRDCIERWREEGRVRRRRRARGRGKRWKGGWKGGGEEEEGRKDRVGTQILAVLCFIITYAHVHTWTDDSNIFLKLETIDGILSSVATILQPFLCTTTVEIIKVSSAITSSKETRILCNSSCTVMVQRSQCAVSKAHVFFGYGCWKVPNRWGSVLAKNACIQLHVVIHICTWYRPNVPSVL